MLRLDAPILGSYRSTAEPIRPRNTAMLALWSYLLAAAVGAAIAWAFFAFRSRDIDPSKYRELLRFRAAVDISADSIYIADRESMKFVDVTATSVERSGYSREELLQMGPND